MQVIPNRNEFFARQKTRSQKCTRMYIFDEMVAVSFNTLCYDVERCREQRVLNRTNKNLHDERKARRVQESWQVVQNIF